MDDPFAGQERQHKSWRDLPPTPPLGWPTSTPVFATTAVGVEAARSLTPPRRPRRGFVIGTALAVGALVLVGTGVMAVGNQLAALQASLTTAVAPGAPEKAAAAVPPTEPLAETAARLLPSVVQIEAGNAVGSGFVAADGGLILTASHVVGRSASVTLKLYDGTSVAGSVVAVDKSIDTAVIHADESAAAGLKPLPIGALAGVHVGDTTIAVGSPFGLSQTVTTGIVSALGRTVPTPVGELHDLIQTDAAINSGNSGGPLADREGKAIGINTAIASASGGSDGIGFAVPIDEALRILDRVKDGTWNPEDNAPADGVGPLGGMLDQFLGPDGMQRLRDLFGLGPDPLQAPGGGSGGSETPNGPSNGSDMGDQMLRQLFDSFLRELQQQLGPGAQIPRSTPQPAPQPAPNGGDDPAAVLDGLMQELLDELFHGTSPDGMPLPPSPDGPTGGQGA